jgi:hypothetical protein
MGLLGLASMAACRGDDDAMADAGPAPVDADPSATDATPDGYRGVAIVAALDRVAIIKADYTTDLCAVLRLVTPAGTQSFGITTPTDWGVEFAGATRGTTDCLSQDFPQVAEYAVSGSGSVTFTVPSGMYHPTMLSVDATIDFNTASAPSWVPASIRFQAMDLAVQ